MRVLLLDEGFMSGAHTAVGLRDAGCDVTILAAAGGRGGCTTDALEWKLAPRIDSILFDALVDRTLAVEPYDHVLPLTEPLQEWVWRRQAPWKQRVFPRTEEWQRALFNNKRILAEQMQRCAYLVQRTFA